MTDIFSKRKRSLIMSSIRSRGTKPEAALLGSIRGILGARRAVREHIVLCGVRADLYIPSLKLVLFCDGCFYHGCPRHGHVPKSNRSYWVPKLERNVRRDRRYRARLRRSGYRVWSIWEHRLHSPRLQSLERSLSARLQPLLCDMTKMALRAKKAIR